MLDGALFINSESIISISEVARWNLARSNDVSTQNNTSWVNRVAVERQYCCVTMWNKLRAFHNFAIYIAGVCVNLIIGLMRSFLEKLLWVKFVMKAASRAMHDQPIAENPSQMLVKAINAMNEARDDETFCNLFSIHFASSAYINFIIVIAGMLKQLSFDWIKMASAQLSAGSVYWKWIKSACLLMKFILRFPLKNFFPSR